MGKSVTFIIAVFSILSLFESDAYAAIRKGRSTYTPTWSKQSAIIRGESNAYLNSQKVLRDPSLPEDFFAAQESRKLCEMRQSYELSQATYEHRKQYGLVKPQDEEAHYKKMSGFSQGALKGLAKNYSKAMTERMKDFAETSAPLAREPVAVAVLAASLYSGRTFKFRIAGLRTETRIDGGDKHGSFAMLLPAGVRSMVKYENDEVSGALRAPLPVVPNVEAVVDSAQRGSVSVNYGVSF